MTLLKSTTFRIGNTVDLVSWIQRAIEVLWLLTVVLVPLAFLGPNLGEGSSILGSFELPKIVILRGLVGLMVALWLVEWALQERTRSETASEPSALSERTGSLVAGLWEWLRARPTRWLTLAAAFFLGSTLLSTLLSSSFQVSLWGEVPGHDSYSAYTTTAYVLLFAVIATHLKTSSQLWRLLGAIVVMGVLVATYAILQHYDHDFLDLMVPPNGSRSTSTMSNPILAAAVLLMTIPISLVGATISLRGPVNTVEFRWKMVLWGGVLVVQVLGMVFTFSRGPWIGTIVAVVGFIGLLVALRHWRTLTRTATVAVLTVVLVAAIVVLPDRLSPGSTTGGPTPPAERAAETITSLGSAFRAVGGISGRLEIWEESWGLMRHHPWFGFDSLSLSFLRPLVGYGPDLFHMTYLQVSPPGFKMLPSEFVHAHNYFVHQGVELGFLGLIASLGVFAVVFVAGGYQLLGRKQNHDIAYRLLLAMILAIVLGRLVEQMVGIARISDLTIFWVLLAVLAALPSVIESDSNAREAELPPHIKRRSSNPPRQENGSIHWRLIGQLVLIGLLITGIGALTWLKGVNYVRAAVVADRAAEQMRTGEYQAALESLERSIDLAPDVNSYYGLRSNVYNAYQNFDLVSQHPICGGLAEPRARNLCLAEEAYLNNLEWVDKRPLSFQSRIALADSALNLANAKNDTNLAQESIKHYGETAELVPTSFVAWNRLADVNLILGQPQAALEALEKSLALVGGHKESVSSLLLQAEAYQNLGQTKQELEALDRAIEVEPKSQKALYIRGSVYQGLGQPERAIEDMDRSIALNSQHAASFSTRALAFTELGRDAEAGEDLERAVDLGADRNVLTEAIKDLQKLRQFLRRYGLWLSNCCRYVRSVELYFLPSRVGVETCPYTDRARWFPVLAGRQLNKTPRHTQPTVKNALQKSISVATAMGTVARVQSRPIIHSSPFVGDAGKMLCGLPKYRSTR